jgi:quercetin dioxygenase-like cupin family protein
LADHSARVAITIHALLGQGTLNVAGRAYRLTPGVIVPVDAHAVHSVQAEPELAILVTFFRRPEPAIGGETTARFD